MAATDLETEKLRRELIAIALMRRADELGGYVPLDELKSFPLPDGTAQRLIDPGLGGIWNPREFAATLTITTSPDGPYPDREMDGFLQYSYQTGPEGGKNLKLRIAKELGLPIIRLNKIAPNFYNPIYPTYVVGDNPIAREFTLTIDEVLRSVPSHGNLSRLEKAYAERVIQQRVHQPAFRARVMLAYEGSCTVCRLRHPELLDAAHIVEDGEPGGDPIVPNGLSLCKIHHAAYDRYLLGIRPDYVVEINGRLLREVDGPMLRHGLQEMDGHTIALPLQARDRPDPDRLAVRHDKFKAS